MRREAWKVAANICGQHGFVGERAEPAADDFAVAPAATPPSGLIVAVGVRGNALPCCTQRQPVARDHVVRQRELVHGAHDRERSRVRHARVTNRKDHPCLQLALAPRRQRRRARLGRRPGEERRFARRTRKEGRPPAIVGVETLPVRRRRARLRRIVRAGDEPRRRRRVAVIAEHVHTAGCQANAY